MDILNPRGSWKELHKIKVSARLCVLTGITLDEVHPPRVICPGSHSKEQVSLPGRRVASGIGHRHADEDIVKTITVYVPGA